MIALSGLWRGMLTATTHFQGVPHQYPGGVLQAEIYNVF